MDKGRLLVEEIKRQQTKRFGRIVVLTGARQVGKTTLLRHQFPNYEYISMDDPQIRRVLLGLSSTQWVSNYPEAILDEVQKEPQLMDIVKAVYDLQNGNKFILTGSSQLLLLSQIRESLAGRCTILELFPLTLPELKTSGWGDVPKLSLFQRILTGEKVPELIPFTLTQDYDQCIEVYQYFLKFGGYPALVADDLDDEDRKQWLRDYQTTYLERDIRDLADFKNLEPFILIQRISALLTGHQLGYTQLAKEAKVHLNTAKRYLQYLSMSYQAILLQPWFKNELKRLSKVPKLHYLDIGIARSVTNNFDGELKGNEFESMVVSEIYKQLKYMPGHFDLYHLRTHDGREVDLLIETPQGYYAFEIKMTSNYNHTDNRHLRHLDDILDKPILHSFVITQDIIPNQNEKNITAVHAAQFLT